MTCEHEEFPEVIMDPNSEEHYFWHCRTCDERWPIGELKLNLGCGEFPERGYVNIDMHSPANIQGDFTKMSFGGVSEVLMSHVLEHFSYRQTTEVLAQVHTWMKPGGKFTVEVPDSHTLLAMVLSQVEVAKASETNWVQLVYGAQTNSGEFHKSGFIESSLVYQVANAGFTVLRTSRFASMNIQREGYPCIRAVATA